MQGRRMLLHKKNNYSQNVIESIINHKGGDNDRSVVKANGDGVA